MNRVLLGSLGILAVIAFALSAQDKGGEKPKDDKPKEGTLAEQIQRYGKNHRRGCGAKLTLSKAELVLKDEAVWVVRVHWEIDYIGPRPPFTIFKPSMELGYGERTCLGFHYEREKGGAAGLTYMCNPKPPGLIGQDKMQYATTEPGKKSISGVLDVATSTQERTISFRDWQRPFYVQLTHHTTESERGGQFDLDAWTGGLISNVIEVTEKK